MHIIIAIASTTHIDKHRHQMAKVALDGMAEQIRTKYIPQLIEHDPKKWIGILLEGKVLQMDDGEFGLYVVSGIFENEQERSLYPIGSNNLVWGRYSSHLDNASTNVIGGFNGDVDNEEKDFTVADLLEKHLDSTSVWVDGSVYFVKHLIASVNDLVIHIWPKDHAPAHFHVISRQKNIDAKFDINTLELISQKGKKISTSDIKKIKHFFQFNPDALKNLKETYDRLQ